jgi:anti-sigma B factor antagonist
MGTERNRETTDGTLTVCISEVGPTLRLAVRGELDMANAATLAAALERADQEGTTSVVVDMSRLEFIDSTGIAVLVAAHRRLNEDGTERLRLVRSESVGVRRVMAVTGLDEELPFE